MKDRTFCDDLMGDYYVHLNGAHNSLVCEMILHGVTMANTTNYFWNSNGFCAEGKDLERHVTCYLTTNLLGLIA